MGWFGSNTGEGQSLSIDVGAFVVRVSRAVASAETPAAAPTYGAWAIETRLIVDDVFYGSSVAGPSYAKLKAATGQPVSAQVNVEDSDMLRVGDRVAIGIQEGDTTRWIFGGYFVAAQLVVDVNEETLVYRCLGPEWAWGAGGGSAGGCLSPVYGQWRRRGSADDAWVAATGTTTTRNLLIRCADERAVFNPGGRKNMTSADVQLLDGGMPVLGRVWEVPDRIIDGTTTAADFWHVAAAARTLVMLNNDPAATGIAAPNWATVDATIGTSKVIRDVDVDTVPLYYALSRALGPEYGFKVTCRPTDVTGVNFAGFTLQFFSRSQDIDGTEAEFTLPVRGTSAADADPSVVRVSAFKDVTKTVTKVTVLGRGYRGVRLKYSGGLTNGLAGAAKACALQHGWKTADGDLAAYAGTGPLGDEVSQITLDSKTQTVRDQWRDRYTVGGKDFPRYAHVFRMFTWNEAAEMTGAGPRYGKTTDFSWYAPDLTGICDATGLAGDASAVAGDFVRRRRRPADTQYMENTADGWRRVPPTLFIAAVPSATTTEPAVTAYRRVPNNWYRVDQERCAVWIVVPDISMCWPLRDLPSAEEATTSDDRTFATLLYTGKLRLIFECSVETDGGLAQTAQRVVEAGSPHLRHVVVRAGPSYVATAQNTTNATPTSLTVTTLSQGPDALKLAEQLRTAGQDEQVHASVLVEAIWPEQAIGKMLKKITGRVVNLTASSGRGAQIVAVRLDPTSMKWEYLTESAAMELKRADRVRLTKRGDQMKREKGRTPTARAERQ